MRKRLLLIFLVLLTAAGIAAGAEEEACSHRWGAWELRDMDCYSGGTRVRTCKNCGEEQRDAVRAGHDMSPWYRSGIPTCTEIGNERRNCKRCDYFEIRRLPMLDHEFGEWMTVKEPGPGTAGEQERVCAMCALTERQETEPLEEEPLLEEELPPAEIPLEEATPMPPAVQEFVQPEGVAVLQCSPGQPANGESYAVGEEIAFEALLYNACEGEVVVIAVADCVGGSALTAERMRMAPGEEMQMSLPYTITEADLVNGPAPDGIAVFWVDMSDGIVKYSREKNFASAEQAQPGGMALSVEVVSAPGNGQFYVPGESIRYAITLENDNVCPFYGIVLMDDLLTADYRSETADGRKCLFAADCFANGRAETIFATYVVTEADAEAGEIWNESLLTCMGYEGTAQMARTRMAVACGFPEAVKPAVLISMKVVSKPANGQYYTPGEEIIYNIAVTNNTDALLQQVTVYDLHSGDAAIGYMAQLGGYGSISCLQTVVVTQTHAQLGSVINQVIVRADGPDGACTAEGDVVSVPVGNPVQ